MAAVVELELDMVRSAEELHTMFEQRLGFPGYYGRNWDAFWDCIRDPGQSMMPAVLRLRGWETLRHRLPRDARLLRECLDDLPSVRPEIAVEWLSA